MSHQSDPEINRFISKKKTITLTPKILFSIMLSKNVALADMDIDDCIHEDSSEISSDYSQNENESSFIGGYQSKREIIHLFENRRV